MKTLFLGLVLFLPVALSAQSVNILYTGETYAPPFYRGGSLWSKQSKLTLFAVPQGLGDQRSLNYRWSQGTTVLGSQSGIGKSTLTYTDTLFSKPQTFAVEIVDTSDAVLAQNWVTVTPSTPGLLVYEDNPLYGFLFNHEVSPTYQLVSQETTFAAFPLFFSTLHREDAANTYSWRSSAGTDSTASTATYRAPEGVSGQVKISVQGANTTAFQQAAQENFLVQFGHEN